MAYVCVCARCPAACMYACGASVFMFLSLRVFTCTVSLSLYGVPCLFLYAYCLLSVFRVEREFSGVLCVHIAHRVFSTISSIVYRIIEYRSSACVPRFNNNNNNSTRRTVSDKEQSWYIPRITFRTKEKKRAHCQLFFSRFPRAIFCCQIFGIRRKYTSKHNIATHINGRQ